MALFGQPDNMLPTSKAHLYPISTFQHYCYKRQIWYLLTDRILHTLLSFSAKSLPTAPLTLHAHPSWSLIAIEKNHPGSQSTWTALSSLLADPSQFLFILQASALLWKVSDSPKSGCSPYYMCATREPKSSFREGHLNVFCQDTANTKRAGDCPVLLITYSTNCRDGTEITRWPKDCLFS